MAKIKNLALEHKMVFIAGDISSHLQDNSPFWNISKAHYSIQNAAKVNNQQGGESFISNKQVYQVVSGHQRVEDKINRFALGNFWRFKTQEWQKYQYGSILQNPSSRVSISFKGTNLCSR